MSKFKFSDCRKTSARGQLRAQILRKFGREEDGSVIILTLVLLVIMLVLGGMAVDFMRFESRRALLQSVSDRAVLAGAELDQTLDSGDVVIDYFEKAGFSGTIVGSPDVSNIGGTRSVGVSAQLDLDTFYLRLIGIDQLQAPAQAAAVEGAGNIEVSLVLDISGSMDNDVSIPDAPDERRIDLLRAAATNFVDELLKPEWEDQISISLIAYSAQVNIGQELFEAINTDYGTVVDSTTGDAFTNQAYCIDFPTAAYSNVAFDDTLTYEQVETWDPFGWAGSATQMRTPNCPKYDFEAIIPISQNATALKTAIGQYEPRQFTSIYLGLKWGVTLLDPSIRDILGGLSSTDPVFADVRPSDYPDSTTALDTKKYVVLMTDGQNVRGRRIKDEYYDEVHEMQRWAEYSHSYWINNLPSGDTAVSWQTMRDPNDIDANEGDDLLQAMCTAAKNEEIVIYSIAMGAGDHGEDEMRDCASSAAHYFQTEGEALDDIFAVIASQITDLRLNL